MQTEQLLTPKQVAELLQIHVGTLEAWRGRGDGPAWMKLGAGSVSARRSRCLFVVSAQR